MIPKAALELPQPIRGQYMEVLDYLINVRQLSKMTMDARKWYVLKVIQYFSSIGYDEVGEAEYEDYLDFIQTSKSKTRGVFRQTMFGARDVAEWAWQRGMIEADVLYKLSYGPCRVHPTLFD